MTQNTLAANFHQGRIAVVACARVAYQFPHFCMVVFVMQRQRPDTVQTGVIAKSPRVAQNIKP
jgi:hypothetical protein